MQKRSLKKQILAILAAAATIGIIVGSLIGSEDTVKYACDAKEFTLEEGQQLPPECQE